MLNAFAHGRLGRDAELRYTAEGTAVADLAIGCNYGRKGSDGKTPTQWVKASMWGKQAEALTEYLTKGKGVAVSLSDVHVREFKRADGSPGWSLEGRVETFDFTGAGPREEGNAPAPAPRQAARPPATKPAQTRPPTGFDDMDDDIPF